MKYPSIRFVVVVLTSLVFISWGSQGHRKISHDSSLSYNNDMAPFLSWVSFLTDHASDADYRKSEDPNEGVRHYIDIDYYPEFRTNGRIAQSWDSIVALHGIWNVTNTGILPWATLSTYNSLKVAMQEGDWSHAMVLAADLGHYVADGHMPLHLTENYNGQLTGNSGIHSRFESTMINANINEIVYNGDSIGEIADVSGYIFNYIYDNYPYLDSILAADNYARSVNSSTSSTAYKQALWQKSKKFTIKLFDDASHALAELIHAAWVEAGKPAMSIGISQQQSNPALTCTVFPNPCNQLLSISYEHPSDAPVTVTMTDLSGNIVRTMVDESSPEGEQQVTFQTHGLSSGIYFIHVNSGKNVAIQKVVKTD